METTPRSDRRDDVPVLKEMPLATVLTFWRPGSFDWTWADEYVDLMERDSAVTDAVRARVEAEGLGFIDHMAPVLLGSDGRVWDGHHRICIAIEKAAHTLMVETTEVA